MKSLVAISKWIVGILFIFSGLVKLNDPIGFAFKLEEYFSPSVLNLEFLAPYALIIAIVIVVFEVVLGVMLLIGYLPRFTTLFLLLMIVFFTFLTFYSAYFNKVTDCGCFGDAIPLTPWQSFYKDLILLVLILILVFNQKKIQPIFVKASHRWIIFLCFMLCFLLAYHVLMHLPVIDFRAYKVGKNIAQEMQIPEDAPEAIFNYHWKFLVDGQEQIHTTQGSYPQVAGEFIGVETELVQEGYVPPILDFSIEAGEEDYTDQMLSEDKLLMVVAFNLSRTERDGWKRIKPTLEKARAKGWRVIGLSASGIPQKQAHNEEFGLDLDFYFTDETVLKAMVRSNPGLIKLRKGTIEQKVHWNDVEKLEL